MYIFKYLIYFIYFILDMVDSVVSIPINNLKCIKDCKSPN